LRPGVVQLVGEVIADVAAPLNGDGLVGDVVGSPTLLRRRLDGAEYSVRRDRRRIAGAPGEPGDVVRLHMDVVHVGGAGADVFGGNAPPAEAFHEAAVRAEDQLAIGRLVVTDDDRLAAA